MDYAAGGSLAGVVSARGRIGVGEAVTVLTSVAQALAHVHGRGVVHGDVSPGNVLFTAQGKPLLADLGIAALLGERQATLDVGTSGFMDICRDTGTGDTDVLQPHRDIYSLAAVGWYCLTGKAPAPGRDRPPLSLLVPDVPKSLAALLEAGLAPDVKARPTASEFASAAYRSAGPEAVDLTGSVHPSVIPELLTRRTPVRTRRRSQAVLGGPARLPWFQRGARHERLPIQRSRKSPKRHLMGAICLGLLGFAWLVPQSAESKAPGPVQSAVAVAGTTPITTPDIPPALLTQLRSEQPESALAALAAVRDMALSEGRPDLLDVVNAPSSPAARADQVLAGQLGAQGVHLAGFKTVLRGAHLASKDGNHAVVDVAAAATGYEERTAQDQLVTWRPAGAEEQISVVLVRESGKWRISEILAGSQ